MEAKDFHLLLCLRLAVHVSNGFFFDANYVIDKLYKRVYDNKEFTFTKEVGYEGCNL